MDVCELQAVKKNTIATTKIIYIDTR